jgi:LPS O-antigen subunit length determinant protein (WzzB/FepE family)
VPQRCVLFSCFAVAFIYLFVWQYYAKALASPIGQKVYAFYTSTQKQVLDIHEEAKRIKEEKEKAAAAAPAPAAATAGSEPATAV